MVSYASGRKRLSPAQEDYLKALYKLEAGGGLVSTSDLAQRLAISAASVTEMVARLSTLGLVAHHRSHGQQLTPEGEAIALELVLPDWQWRRRTWLPHPACRCGAAHWDEQLRA